MDDNARTGELRRKLEKDPASRLFAQLAEELRKDGKQDEAISVARKGLEKNPNYPSARLTLARALLDSGRPAEARPELEAIVKASPDNIMASRLLGDALAELGETAQALQQFEKTLRLSPGDKVVIERMAEIKARQAPAPPAEPPPVVPSPAAPVAEAQVPAAPQAPLPSVFPEAALPSVFPEVPFPTVPVPPDHAPPAVPPPAAPTVVALDRDLASGTFSPGSLKAADVQKHLEEAAPASPERVPAEPQARAAAPHPGLAAVTPPAAAPAKDLSPAVVGSELPAVETPAEAGDDYGARTLPLTSLTLADLYLQQGLKAEASAVLSQVLKEEPDNAQAKSKLAAVSIELAGAPSAPPPLPAITPSRAPRTRAEVRESTLASLKAFASAVEREAVQQKATERGAF